ncbi:MAG: tandem-95 repeat protein, partial [Candidatus Omnitrophica bacterium]|nr:tandem-95 repeat protein [Candidatus Omnitrophota bacterium]
GTLSGTAPNVTYTPAVNYSGTDTFTFKVKDVSLAESVAAAVTLTVTGTNDAPMALGQTVSVLEDTAKTITLTGSDDDGDVLTYAIFAQPVHGTLTGTAPNVIYTPAVNFNGPDKFSFRVSDGTADPVEAVVTVMVTPVNDAPMALGQSVSTAEDTAKTITLTGTDDDGDALSFAIVTPPKHGSVIVGSNSANKLIPGWTLNAIYTPDADFSGEDVFTFKANDGTIDSASATVNIVVIQQTFSLEASAGKGGSISPSGAITVLKGVAQYFTVTPNEGYDIGQVLVDGVTHELKGNRLTLSNVTASHVISASFIPQDRYITASASVGGAIYPSGTVATHYGESRTFTIIPDPGYNVERVIVDNERATTIGNQYVFDNVTTAHTIQVNFGITPHVLTIASPVNGSITNHSDPIVNYSMTSGKVLSMSLRRGADPEQSVDIVPAGGSLGPLSDGTYRLKIISSLAGGALSTAEVSFTVDTISPTLTIDAPANGALVNKSTPTLEYTLSDGKPLSFELDSQEIVDIPSGSIFQQLEEGAHTLKIVAIDQAGNQASMQIRFTVDTEAPELTIISPPLNTIIYKAKPELLYVSNERITEMALDGKPINPVLISGSELPELADGEHVLTVVAMDLAGNQAVEQSRFTIDSRAPVIEISAPAASIPSIPDPVAANIPAPKISKEPVKNVPVEIHGTPSRVQMVNNIRNLLVPVVVPRAAAVAAERTVDPKIALNQGSPSLKTSSEIKAKIIPMPVSAGNLQTGVTKKASPAVLVPQPIKPDTKVVVWTDSAKDRYPAINKQPKEFKLQELLQKPEIKVTKMPLINESTKVLPPIVEFGSDPQIDPLLNGQEPEQEVISEPVAIPAPIKEEVVADLPEPRAIAVEQKSLFGLVKAFQLRVLSGDGQPVTWEIKSNKGTLSWLRLDSKTGVVHCFGIGKVAIELDLVVKTRSGKKWQLKCALISRP